MTCVSVVHDDVTCAPRPVASWCDGCLQDRAVELNDVGRLSDQQAEELFRIRIEQQARRILLAHAFPPPRDTIARPSSGPTRPEVAPTGEETSTSGVGWPD